MDRKNRIYAAIDLKSFYASVECVERGLNPLTTNLVVADAGRTEKTICLAVSPSLKKYGIPGRPRLFEVVQKVREANIRLQLDQPIEYIVAKPRMALYMKYSATIYNIYMRHVAPEDVHVYSIDEVFIDITEYLDLNRMTAREFVRMMIQDILDEVGITATAGIGTNLYLSKIAMDIVAKHIEADEYGVRIAELDEMSYRRLMWTHKPLTDFWRIGRGYAKKLYEHGLHTMGDIARCSIGVKPNFHNEDLLYKLFGINAELLIDHAWGYEPCSIADVKAYKPQSKSTGAGQVLHTAYTNEKARIVVREMAEQLSLDLVDKGLETDQVVLTVGYDIENLKNPEIRNAYKGEVKTDMYGRKIPKHAGGRKNFPKKTSSTREIVDAMLDLFDEITDSRLLVRRVNLTVNHIIEEGKEEISETYEQLDLFTNFEDKVKREKEEKERREKEKNLQHAIIDVKKKYGKNAILKGTNFMDGATAKDRNSQIGGHKA